MSDKQAYLQKWEAQFKEWKAEIDVLKAKADKAEANMKIQYDKEIKYFQTKMDSAKDNLIKLQEAGEEKWEDLKETLDKTWTDLKGAFSNMISKVK